MAELFNAFDNFKPFVGGAINSSIQIESLDPVIYDTARRHLTPYLGQDFYDVLVADYMANGTAGDYSMIMPYLQRPLALLSIFEYTKVASIEFGEGGMFRMENDTRKSAYRYQEKQFQEYFLEKGYDALETLLKFLDKNKNDLPLWTIQDEAMAHLRPLLNYALDLRALVNVQCDRYTFETIRPIIAEVESFGVQALLPTAFWNHLIDLHLNGGFSPFEKSLLTFIRMAIGHRAYQEAIKVQWVTMRNGRIYATETTRDMAYDDRIVPGAQAGGMFNLAHQTWADMHTARWKQYIMDNPTEFPLVFDVASGGTNPDADAWHINTDAEAVDAANAEVARLNKAVVLF